MYQPWVSLKDRLSKSQGGFGGAISLMDYQVTRELEDVTFNDGSHSLIR